MIGAYLGLPLPKDSKTRYTALLISPVVAKPKTAVCVTLAYSTQGTTVGANGFIGLSYRKHGTNSGLMAMRLWYNIPGVWNLEQQTIRWAYSEENTIMQILIILFLLVWLFCPVNFYFIIRISKYSNNIILIFQANVRL